MLSETSLRVVESILESQPKVLAAWLFGSQVSGRARPDSDVDIAVLCKDALSLQEQLGLTAELERALGVERVDLVTVDASQPVLAFEAISGRPIFTRSLHERAAFISLVSRVYEDVMVNLKKTLSYRKDS